MTNARRGRPRRGRLAGLLACVLLVSALGALNASSAAALGEQCSGTKVGGLGAFLQTRAQLRWSSSNELGFNGSSHPAACNGSQGSGGKPAASYVPVSSAAALRAWGAEDGALHAKEFGFPVNFIGTDIAPSGPVTGEGATMLDKMRKALGSDVAVVPVTQTALAIVANPPTLPGHPGCTVPRVTGTQLQKVFSGEIKNWRQLSAASDSALGGACDQAITRVVREESAGTTYQFKHYLQQVNSAGLPCTGGTQRNWAQLQAPFGGEVPANVEWPRTSACQEGEGPLTAVSTGNGEGEIGTLQYVSQNPGTITYSSLPEAQDQAPKQIIEVNNGVKFVSPATESGAANCGAAKYPLPEGSEKGINVDWSQVYGSDPKIGETDKSAYPICTLSWDVVPTNAAGLFGGKAATTLRDYLNFVLAPGGGQASVRSIGYQDLPGPVTEAALAAVSQIGGEEKEEEGEEEEEEKEEEPPVTTGTVLCSTKPEEVGGVLRCPSGQEYGGQIGGTLVSGSTATFKQPGGPEEPTIACEKGAFVGNFEKDGSSAGSGLEILYFSGCSNPFGGSSTEAFLYEAPASKFVYLSSLAPEGALVLARNGGAQVSLRIKSSKGWCDYRALNLGGQIVNAGSFTPQPPYSSPGDTRWVIQGLWVYQEGEGPCAEALDQSAQMTVNQGGPESGSTLYIAGE